ncbi:MAG: ABC transporter substrate-binding protein [Vulcanimicrobiaceae bacterium]
MGYRRFAAVLTLLTLLAGCAPGRQPNDTIRFDLAGDPSSLNPLFIHPDAASVEAQVDRLSFLPFVDMNAQGRLVPVLLRVIPTQRNGGISTDGRTIVYHLRRDVRWSDGVPVTSADVLFTLHAILNPHNPVRSHAGYELIKHARAPGPYTVVLRLKHAWAPAATTFFSYGASPQVVLPAHVLRNEEPLAQAPFNAGPNVVDGPYILSQWQRGDRLVYRRNPLYWRAEPKLHRIVARIVADPSTNLLLLRTGSIDWNLIAPNQRADLAGVHGIAFDRVPTSVVAGIAINVTHRPLGNVLVRRAIAMGIDRQAISRKITLGVYPVTNQLQPRFSWAYDPNIREPAYDPRAAEALLRGAGWRRGSDGIRVKNGRRLRLVFVEFPESTTGVRVATFVAAALRTIGIDVVLKSVSMAQLFLPKTGLLASGSFDLAYVPWTMGADPDDSAVLACGAPENYMRWCDPRVNALERAALDTSSQARRKRIYAQIARRVASAVPIVYLFNADYLYAYRTRMRGFAPNAFLPTWNAARWSLR